MKTLLKFFIIAVGMLMVVSGIAYAADVTVESNVGITSDSVCTLTITSSDLIVSPAPTTKGPSTTTFTNSPIVMSFTDSGVTSPTGDILRAKISSSLPGQYGASKTYEIYVGPPTYTPDADSDFTAGELSTSIGRKLSDSDQEVLAFNSGSASGHILTGSYSAPAQLVINSDKRLYGDTTDVITITYTLLDK